MSIPNFWRDYSQRGKRIITILVFFLLSLIITMAGVLTPLSSEDAKARNDELDQVQARFQNMDVWEKSVAIFVNNFRICMWMFVPIAGPLIGFYALYNTGLYIGAGSQVIHMSGVVILLFLFIFPHTWLEFIVYSTALSESFWLPWSIVRRKTKQEIKKMLLTIAVCAAILLGAALVEAWILAASP